MNPTKNTKTERNSTRRASGEELAKALILREEGVKKNSKGQHIVYKCSEGYLTMGYGHKLTEKDKKIYKFGDPVSNEIVNKYWQKDFPNAWNRARNWVGPQIFDNLVPERQAVVAGMGFQLKNIHGFKEFKEALANHDYNRAAKEMYDSKWRREDTPERAYRAINIMKNPRAIYSMKDVMQKIPNSAQLTRPNSSKSQNSNLGGINLSVSIEEVLNSVEFRKIKGIYVEENFSEISLVYDDHLQSNIIDIKDLLVPLLVYYDDSIKSKGIAFSLDPADPKNPRGPYQRKVFYPDEVEGKKIIEGTEFGDILFQADWLMKQMSLGVNAHQQPFSYPKELQNVGLSPQEYPNSDAGWQRLWFELDKLEFSDLKRRDDDDSNGLLFSGIKIKVVAKEMQIGDDGKLKDSTNSSQNKSCYSFANSFTNNYEKIEQHFPILKRLKQSH